jgi:hypothetical protein
MPQSRPVDELSAAGPRPRPAPHPRDSAEAVTGSPSGEPRDALLPEGLR